MVSHEVPHVSVCEAETGYIGPMGQAATLEEDICRVAVSRSVAQWSEHPPDLRKVGGSNPPRPTVGKYPTEEKYKKAIGRQQFCVPMELQKV